MTDQIDRSVLPIRRPAFSGVAAKTLGGSQPDWGLIGHVKPPAGAPKVLLCFARHQVESGLEEKMGAALPPGSAGIVAIYDRGKAGTVDATLASAVRKSVAQVDGGGAKKLKAALADAQAGLGG